jgi:hypothetical protein
MVHMTTPAEIVNRQLQAYNERNIHDYCALFSEDAVVFKLNGNHVLARGIDEIREYYTERFKSQQLFCRIKNRIELGNFVIDHEHVVGIGEGALEVVAIYEIRDSLIQSIHVLWP